MSSLLVRKTAGFSISGDGLGAALVRPGQTAVLGSWSGGGSFDMYSAAGVAAALGSVVTDSGIRAPLACVALPDSIARVTLLDFEELPVKKSEAAAIITGRAARALGIEAASYCMDFAVSTGAAGAKALCVAVRKPLVEAIEGSLASAGMKAGRVSLQSLSLANLLPDSKQDAAVVARLSDWLTVMVFRAGVLDFYRSKAAVGPDAARETLASFRYYTGANPGASLERVYLFDSTGELAGGISGEAPAMVEAVRPEGLLKSGSALDLKLLCAAGGCL